ncbi:MAG: glycosyltransferase family 2 protein [Simkaniaceae bacterium]|nr:MAG: glycosyltransferase family 2 protein [Simkaniaceae bacterium]
MSTLSVILPNYNHSALLTTACDAIFAQSVQPLEVIIIDDASTDLSLKVITSLQAKYSSIKLIQNQKNVGPVLTINRGIKEAKGTYLAFCSADDFILPGFFEKSLELLEMNPILGICCGKATHFKASNPNQISIETMPLPDKVQIFKPNELIKLFRKSTFFIHTNCSIYRKKYIDEFGGLDSNLLSISDWYVTCQIALHYGVGYIPEPFGAFRLSPTSYAQALKNSPIKDEMFQHLMKKVKSEGKAWDRVVKNSGLLAQAGVRMILFLLKRPQYWNYFPKAFFKKCQFAFNHMF